MTKGKKPYKALRNFIISLIILVLLAVFLPFFLKGPDKQALITPDKIKIPEIKLINKKPQDDRRDPIRKGTQAHKNKNVIYKWKDKHGVIHFSDYPNPDGPSEEIAAVPYRSPGKNAKSSRKNITDTAKPDSDDTPSLSFPMSLSPSHVKKLKEDAEKIREVLQQRYENMSQTREK